MTRRPCRGGCPRRRGRARAPSGTGGSCPPCTRRTTRRCACSQLCRREEALFTPMQLFRRCASGSGQSRAARRRRRAGPSRTHSSPLRRTGGVKRRCSQRRPAACIASRERRAMPEMWGDVGRGGERWRLERTAGDAHAHRCEDDALDLEVAHHADLSIHQAPHPHGFKERESGWAPCRPMQELSESSAGSKKRVGPSPGSASVHTPSRRPAGR